MEPARCACPACGGSRLSKLGGDVTETLDMIRRQWKVMQHVREKFSCRDCEAVTQAPAPFYAMPRGWAGPSLAAQSWPQLSDVLRSDPNAYPSGEGRLAASDAASNVRSWDRSQDWSYDLECEAVWAKRSSWWSGASAVAGEVPGATVRDVAS